MFTSSKPHPPQLIPENLMLFKPARALIRQTGSDGALLCSSCVISENLFNLSESQPPSPMLRGQITWDTAFEALAMVSRTKQALNRWPPTQGGSKAKWLWGQTLGSDSGVRVHFLSTTHQLRACGPLQVSHASVSSSVKWRQWWR